jgi:hypothetical protein
MVDSVDQSLVQVVLADFQCSGHMDLFRVYGHDLVQGSSCED